MKRLCFNIPGLVTIPVLVFAFGVIVQNLIVQFSFSQGLKRPVIVQEVVPNIDIVKKKKKWQADTSNTRSEKRVIADSIRIQFAVTDSNTARTKLNVNLQKGTQGKLIEIKTTNDSLLQLVEAKKNRVYKFLLVPEEKPKDAVRIDSLAHKIDHKKVAPSKKRSWYKIFIK